MQQRASIQRGLGAAAVSALAVTALAASPALAAPVPGNTEVVAISPDGQAQDGQTWHPQITPDGRYVVFDSSARNLTATPEGGSSWDVFVKDLKTRKITKVSTGLNGQPANDDSLFPDITPDGRYVVFVSAATNLVAGDDTSVRANEIFVKDLKTGRTTKVISENLGDDGNFDSPTISADGNTIAFSSTHPDLVAGDTNGTSDVFVWKRSTGKVTRVSVSSSGAQGSSSTNSPYRGSFAPAISADGKSVVFRSGDDNLVRNDTNNLADIFVHTLDNHRTTRVSVGPNGEQITGGQPIDGSAADAPSISADGRVIAYEGYAIKGLTGQDTGETFQVYVYDRRTGKTEAAARTLIGTVAIANSAVAEISPDGQFVVFQSGSNELVAGDSGTEVDVFVRNLKNTKIVKASVGVDGALANGSSGTFGTTISAGGRTVVFDSSADNLVEGPANPNNDLYLHRFTK
ncbi:TolB family protein [Kineosporia babensis]|uniref:WD40 repeat protein n=1 Tax=Kineosporia babensis TaxID=499548 RepID=A0A9X1SWP6_9ACTN|nr:hypothetical protein [Kineosporia babensis]MCD5315026.1 hypothetical protein [Kineosporia babensis]